MFYWKIIALKQQLIAKGLSQRHLFLYIIIVVILEELAFNLFMYMPMEDYNVYDFTNSLISLIFISFGTYQIYRANGGSQGRQFAERYFSIGFVISVRFSVLLIPYFIVMSIFVWSTEPDDGGLATMWYDSAVYACVLLALYWRIIVHVGDVAGAAENN